MERRAALIMLFAAGALAACGDTPGGAPAAQGPAETWRAPPVLLEARRDARSLVISGRAAPGARIAMTATTGPAYASAVDDGGAFTLHLGLPLTPTLFRAETQAGSIAARAAGWLLVTPVPDGVSAVLTPGEPSRLLERSALLEAVDFDGQSLLVSGRAQPRQPVTVTVGPMTAAVEADGQGRYVARFLQTPPGPIAVTATGAEGSAQARLDLSGTTGEALSVTPQGQGFLVRWPLPGGGAQTTWISALSDAP